MCIKSHQIWHVLTLSVGLLRAQIFLGVGIAQAFKPYLPNVDYEAKYCFSIMYVKLLSSTTILLRVQIFSIKNCA